MKVTLRRARLVLGWVTGRGFNFRCRDLFQYITSQPGQLSLAIPWWVARRNEYQPEDSDALRLGSKGRYGSGAEGVLCATMSPNFDS